MSLPKKHHKKAKMHQNPPHWIFVVPSLGCSRHWLEQEKYFLTGAMELPALPA